MRKDVLTFKLAIQGSKGYRFMTADSELMSHTGTGIGGKSQEDRIFLSLLWIAQCILNTQSKKKMKKHSVLELSDDLIRSLTRAKTDIYIDPITALQLGFTDAVIPEEALHGDTPSSMVVRADDERVKNAKIITNFQNKC